MSGTGPTAAEIRIGDGELAIAWSDGHRTHLPLEVVRVNCSCVQCRDLRADGSTVWPRPGAPDHLGVEDATLMGAWGLSIRWNDGHEAGVYTWDALRAACDCADCRRGYR